MRTPTASPPARPRPGLSRIALLGIPLLLWGCFEEPVVERLHLRFTPGTVEVTASVEIHESTAESELLTRRVQQVERSVLAGNDPWSARFEKLAPERESFRWDKEEGKLVRAERRAVSSDPRRLERFFGDTAILAQYTTGPLEETGRAPGGSWASLGLYPGPGDRANRQQARKVAETLETWTALAARYLEATETLYRYLERYPERARPCLTTLYGDLLDDAEEPALSEDEVAMGREVADAIGELLGILQVDRQEGYSLNELSRLVYDPFPARITVEVPGEVLEVEGFQREGFEPSDDPAADPSSGRRSGPRVLSIPGLGLWESWLALEGRWVSPDPAAGFYRLALEEDADAAFPELLAAERRVEPAPSAAEIRTALENLLRPEPAYRVVWAEPAAAPDAAASSGSR